MESYEGRIYEASGVPRQATYPQNPCWEKLEKSGLSLLGIPLQEVGILYWMRNIM